MPKTPKNPKNPRSKKNCSVLSTDFKSEAVVYDDGPKIDIIGKVPEVCRSKIFEYSGDWPHLKFAFVNKHEFNTAKTKFVLYEMYEYEKIMRSTLTQKLGKLIKTRYPDIRDIEPEIITNVFAQTMMSFTKEIDPSLSQCKEPPIKLPEQHIYWSLLMYCIVPTFTRIDFPDAYPFANLDILAKVAPGLLTALVSQFPIIPKSETKFDLLKCVRLNKSLFSNLKELDIITFNHQVSFIPQHLTKFTINDWDDKPNISLASFLKKLPPTILYLCLHCKPGTNFTDIIPNIPPNTTHLKIECQTFNENLSGLPCLHTLELFSSSYTHNLKTLPSSLKRLDLHLTSFTEFLTAMKDDLRCLSSIEELGIYAGIEQRFEFKTGTYHNLPRNLKKLVLNAFLAKTLDGLPPTLVDLSIGLTDMNIRTIPSVSSFNAKHDFNAPLKNLPPGLRKLFINSHIFNQPLDKLPSGLESLTINSFKFNQPLNKLPSTLRSFILHNRLYYNSVTPIGSTFNQRVDRLPALTTFSIHSNAFNHPIDRLPSTLRSFTVVSDIFNRKVDRFPPGLDSVSIFSKQFCKRIHRFPPMLSSIEIISDLDFNEECEVDSDVSFRNAMISIQKGSFESELATCNKFTEFEFNNPIDHLPKGLQSMIIYIKDQAHMQVVGEALIKHGIHCWISTGKQNFIFGDTN